MQFPKGTKQKSSISNANAKHCQKRASYPASWRDTRHTPPIPHSSKAAILSDPKIGTPKDQYRIIPMDPRHKLYKTLDTLAIDPENTLTENMSARTDDEAARVQATSGVTMEGLKRKLEEGLGATYVEIEDLSGTFPAHLICGFWRAQFACLEVAVGNSCRSHKNMLIRRYRRMRTNVRSHHRITEFRQKDDAGAASPCE